MPNIQETVWDISFCSARTDRALVYIFCVLGKALFGMIFSPLYDHVINRTGFLYCSSWKCQLPTRLNIPVEAKTTIAHCCAISLCCWATNLDYYGCTCERDEYEDDGSNCALCCCFSIVRNAIPKTPFLCNH